MSNNDVVLLGDMLERSREETRAVLSETDHHTYYAAKYYLHEMQPSHDDLLSGLVDGTHDGGIDGIYIYANGYCVRDDGPLPGIGKKPDLDLIIMQVKNTTGFGEDAVDKLTLNLPQLLDISRDEKELEKTFNPRVIELTRRFLGLYRSASLPNLRIYIAFASLRADGVHENVVRRSKALEAALLSAFRNSHIHTEFLDAAALFDLAQRPTVSTRTLALAENPISTDLTGGLVGLVKLAEFERFITDESGRLDSSLFDANVRDYEGETPVNRKIQSTLQDEESGLDFWWLNNGITVVASRVSGTAKHLILESAQIVNGLQTSHEIYRRSRQAATDKGDRSVLLKIIEVSDESKRDKIIEATNSQTALAPSALRATDRVQRQIEDFLASNQLFYERRKNLYANRNVPFEKLVSIDDMGRALLATVAQLPHVARSMPSRIYENDIYDTLFSPKNELGCYLGAISITRAVESYLRGNRTTRDNTADLEFHLSMLAAIALTRKERPKDRDLARVNVEDLRPLLPELLRIVQDSFADVTRRQGETLFERLSKNSAVTTVILAKARRYLAASTRSR